MTRFISNPRMSVFSKLQWATRCDGHRNGGKCQEVVFVTNSERLIKDGWYVSWEEEQDICPACVIAGVPLLGTPHPKWVPLT